MKGEKNNTSENKGSSVIGLSLLGFAIYQLLLKPLYFEPKKVQARQPKGIYFEIEKEMLGSNSFFMGSPMGSLSSDDDLSNPNIQKRWLEVFKEFCIQKDWNKEKCLQQLNAFNQERRSRLQAEKDQENNEQKRKLAKEKELGF